jgi:hypothetical protein
MRRSCQLLALVCSSALLGHSVARADFSYADFSSTSGLVLNGAAQQAGNVLKVSGIVNQGAGSTWHATPQTVANGFVTSFAFRIVGQGADGLTFTIQNSGAAALGSPGSGIGYAGIPNSVSIEWDTWYNGADGNGDISDNHISVQTRGLSPNSDNHSFSLGAVTDFVHDFQDGNVHQVRIEYVPNLLRIFSDNQSVVPTLQVPLDLSSTLSLANGTAYVGFTSSTGFGIQDHDLLTWTFAVPEASTATLAMAAAFSIVVFRATRRTGATERGGFLSDPSSP